MIARRLPYRDYLAEMARHKIVLQADKSAVPGQVAGDALLCRMPCVGGDGAIDRLAFPKTCGFGRSLGESVRTCRAIAARSVIFYTRIVAEAQKQALAQLRNLDAVSEQLAEFLRHARRNAPAP